MKAAETLPNAGPSILYIYINPGTHAIIIYTRKINVYIYTTDIILPTTTTTTTAQQREKIGGKEKTSTTWIFHQGRAILYPAVL
jgi:hypothetical protein